MSTTVHSHKVQVVFVVDNQSAELRAAFLQCERGAKQKRLLGQDGFSRRCGIEKPRAVLPSGLHQQPHQSTVQKVSACVMNSSQLRNATKTPYHFIKADFENGLASSLVRHARVSVTVENNRRRQAWCNVLRRKDHETHHDHGFKILEGCLPQTWLEIVNAIAPASASRATNYLVEVDHGRRSRRGVGVAGSVVTRVRPSVVRSWPGGDSWSICHVKRSLRKQMAF